ncbi:unnamed protein product [Rotaria sp. Silwood2]|nr:unnamed protein product [Rotaria sp. Silwood2]
MSLISWNSWNESNLDRVIEQIDPLTSGNWDYYTPFKGWICYGLNAEKFGSTLVTSDDFSDEWIVGFHGFRRDTLQSLQFITQERLKSGCDTDNRQFETSKDVGPNAPFFN